MTTFVCSAWGAHTPKAHPTEVTLAPSRVRASTSRCAAFGPVAEAPNRALRSALVSAATIGVTHDGAVCGSAETDSSSRSSRLACEIAWLLYFAVDETTLDLLRAISTAPSWREGYTAGTCYTR